MVYLLSLSRMMAEVVMESESGDRWSKNTFIKCLLFGADSGEDEQRGEMMDFI